MSKKPATTQPVPKAQATAPAKVVAPAPVAPSAKPVSTLQSEITKVIHDIANASADTKKAVRSAVVSNAAEYKFNLENNKTLSVLVFYLPFTFIRDNRPLLTKIINELQKKRGQFVFPIAKRTMINSKSDFKQIIPRNRTLTSVYDSILDDLIFPASIIGRRMRYRSNGSLLTKIFLSDDTKVYLEDKVKIIAELYFKLTNRKIAFEFRRESFFAIIPEIKAPVKKTHTRKAQH